MTVGACTLVVLSVLVATGVDSSTARAKPTLAIVDRAPLVVRGSGFPARQRVAVVVHAGDTVRRSVKASARGTFVVRFDAIRVDPCTGTTVLAVGARGTLARLKIGLRECPGPAFDP